MPHYVVEKVREALNTQKKAVNGSTILIAGITYKRDIDDMRESPALDVMHKLQEQGATLRYSDPWIAELPATAWSGGRTLKSVRLEAKQLLAADCVVILTDHKAFDYDLVVNASRLVVDTRNATKIRAAHVFRLGAPQTHAALVEV
jgi:UDP-N-acetyl-D-glucosamine dehydrogenase